MDSKVVVYSSEPESVINSNALKDCRNKIP
jgi:hypothetical protein